MKHGDIQYQSYATLNYGAGVPHVQRTTIQLQGGTSAVPFILLKNGANYYLYRYGSYWGPYEDIRCCTARYWANYFYAGYITRSGADFTPYYYTMPAFTALPTRTVSLTGGYSIQQWVAAYYYYDDVRYYIVIYAAGNGTNHYYGISQITASGITSLYTTGTYAGDAPLIPAPCLRYPVDAWLYYNVLKTGSTYTLLYVRPGSSPYVTIVDTIAFPSGYEIPVCALNAFDNRFQITLKKTSDGSYTQFIFTDTTVPVPTYNGYILWPPQEVLLAIGQTLTVDLTNELYILINRNYPGVHPVAEIDGITDIVFGWEFNRVYTYYYDGYHRSRSAFFYLYTLPIAGGVLNEKTADITLSSAISVFRNKHLFLYDNSNNLVARLLIQSVRYENGLQQLLCRNLANEIETLSESAVYNTYDTNAIVSDQLKNAQYIYPGTLEGGETSLTVREGYSLLETLADLGFIQNGIWYITPAGSVEFRTDTFESGPTFSIENANYDPNTYSEIKSNYGGVRIYGGYYGGVQSIRELWDDRGDRALVLETEYPTIYEEPTLDQIAANILSWQQSGIKNIKLRYFFGYVYRGLRCSVNLSGFGIEFGQSEPVSAWYGYILSSSFDLLSEQAQIELCSAPVRAVRERISASISQQIKNVGENHETRLTTLETGYRFVPIHSTTDIWQEAYIGQGNTVTDEYNCFSVDGNNRWTRISGSIYQASLGTMPIIPTNAKGLKLLIETFATGAANNNWTSIVGKDNANLRTFNYAPPTANYSHCIQADVFWTTGNEGRILVKINSVTGWLYCKWRCLGYWI